MLRYSVHSQSVTMLLVIMKIIHFHMKIPHL
uniref:Uncharacterized protein n=1 Tax=Anguilla anguilla TaxID=7936 RepID=A0A0E9VAZ9_ANGAN